MSEQNENKNEKNSNSYPLSLINLIKKIQKDSMNISNILAERKKNFIQEYLKMNSISISSSCSVKTDYTYKYGHLTLCNSKLVINQYESNKITNLNNPRQDVNRTDLYLLENRENLMQGEDILYPIFFIDFNLATCQLMIHRAKQKFRFNYIR
jgi:hypothetical protein